jgi:hypothetical protein
MLKVHGVTTIVMPRILNYYTKHKGKWVTEYNPCLNGKLPLHVSTVHPKRRKLLLILKWARDLSECRK